MIKLIINAKVTKMLSDTITDVEQTIVQYSLWYIPQTPSRSILHIMSVLHIVSVTSSTSMTNDLEPHPQHIHQCNLTIV